MNDRNPLSELGDRSPQGRANARRHLKNCVFVSHSGKDWPFINENIESTLEQALSVATYTRREGTWYYPYGIFCTSYARLGDFYASTVSIALTECRAFVIVVSRNAMTSQWVKKELAHADGRFRRILAVCIDDTSLADCVAAFGVPSIFQGAHRVISLRLNAGIPNDATNLLAVATEYLRSRYRTVLGVKRPMGGPIENGAA